MSLRTGAATGAVVDAVGEVELRWPAGRLQQVRLRPSAPWSKPQNMLAPTPWSRSLGWNQAGA